jgi:hypothetical protein
MIIGTRRCVASTGANSRKDAIMTDDANTKPEFKIVFAQGSFDDFEGTQAELDELVAAITEQLASGDFETESSEVTAEDWAALPDHIKESLIAEFEAIEAEAPTPRTLH